MPPWDHTEGLRIGPSEVEEEWAFLRERGTPVCARHLCGQFHFCTDIPAPSVCGGEPRLTEADISSQRMHALDGFREGTPLPNHQFTLFTIMN